MYTLIGSAKTRALRVLWMLEELGEPYEHHAAPPRSDAARDANPTGKVPTLVCDGVKITDSTAILTFLADRHGSFTHPAGSTARAQQDSLTHFILDEIDAVLWTAARHSFILPEEHRVPAVKDSLKWEFARSLGFLAQRIEDGPFVMGATMTVPDILLTHCCTWAQAARFPLDEPKIADYLTRIQTRPALQRAMAQRQDTP